MAHVLHIEDNPVNRMLVRGLLQAAGHDVAEASTGVEGIRLAKELIPDLVLVDINVPDLDGYEVTLRLRGVAGLQDVPIVAITALGDRETSLAVGADGFLQKPIDTATFASSVEGFLKHRPKIDSRPDMLRTQSQKIVEKLERKIVELSDANTRLEEMVRLRQEFLRNVAHELATPLTPVVGYVQLLLDEELGSLNDAQRRCLSSVTRSTERLRRVVDTLLDVSALESGRLRLCQEAYDFAEVVENVVRSASAGAASKDVSLRFSETDDEMPAVGDTARLKKAIVHIIDNAVQFSDAGSSVYVGLSVNDACFELLVADDGPGIPAEELERVLQPFYQVDGSTTRAHAGVGLGLAFASRVTSAMGGGVQVTSPPAREVGGHLATGTCVVLTVKRMPQ